ncbi:hypothetical protein [Rhodococcus gordoniae]|uniref:hypothetical protein n=1 Tax=Rhodococcus gordoniae TaxID=223392 RepID=UPI0020CFCC8D|nr:hypothetical protein [Rhodococcus gordoniae]UTT47317.1 hypothetical protein NMQ04_13640 [Rhodococcus gordoniae]
MTVRSAAARIGSVVFLATAAYAAAPGALAHSAAPPAENTAAAATVTALVADDPERALSSLPADFAGVMGYSPIVEQHPGGTAVLTDPEGGCSAPVPLPSSFESACRVHDLGYDLLRYAHTTGSELGTAARRDLDGLFARHLDTVCRSETGITACTRIAGISSAAVELNSWRQGHRTPVAESPWVPAVAAGSVVLAYTARRVRR